MTVAGFIQPTDSTQVLFVEIAAVRARRQSCETGTAEYIELTNEIGRLTAEIRRKRADEMREE